MFLQQEYSKGRLISNFCIYLTLEWRLTVRRYLTFYVPGGLGTAFANSSEIIHSPITIALTKELHITRNPQKP